MSPATAKKLLRSWRDELRLIAGKHGGYANPPDIVEWARQHPKSALYQRFDWDDTSAAHQYRLWQARQLIVQVRAEYPDGKPRQEFVSVLEDRGEKGYDTLVRVMSDTDRRAGFLAQALVELKRWREKYRDFEELAKVYAAIDSLG